MGEEFVKEIKRIFVKYDKDCYISRIIFMVNFDICCLELCFKFICLRVFIESNFLCMDKMSCLVYEVFEVYINGDCLVVKDYI